MFDIVIKNGEVITDGKIFDFDIGIKDGIVKSLAYNLKAKRIIDAKGAVVSPGFIDMHTHSDISFIMHPRSESKLYQGVTTELVACCGFSHYPYSQSGLEVMKKNHELTAYDSESLNAFIEKFKKPMSINWASCIGHGPLRLSVVGDKDLRATDGQIQEMKDLLHKELSSGGFALSLGMAYAPGMFADTKEYIELAKVVKKHNKFITAHIRNENDDVFESLKELIKIGEISGARIHVSHLKLGYGSWHRADDLLEVIDQAKKKGVEISFEQYPYLASATGLSAVLPNWVHDGGTEMMVKRFKNNRPEVIEGIISSNSYKMGLDRIKVLSTKGFLPEADGKSIDEISMILNLSGPEAILYLLENMNCDVPTIRFIMDEEDVFKIASRKDCVVISDGSSGSLDRDEVKEMPHPRSYGTFPRYIRLNREKKWMSLEQALYKMTALPAKLMGLVNRGSIKEGYAADITIFNKETIRDQASYGQPIAPATGIEYVIVNGAIAYENGKATTESAGEILLNL
jgi:N-acyl-D-amino-acid deacylase